MKYKLHALTISLTITAAVFLPGIGLADSAADALLEKCFLAEMKVRSLQTDFTLHQEIGAVTRTLRGSMKLQKPNRALIDLQGAQADDQRTFVSDGRQFTTYYNNDNEFVRELPDQTGANIGRVTPTEGTVFFNPDILNQIRSRGTGIKIVGNEIVDGVTCKTLQVTGAGPNSIYRLLIAPDFLLRGVRIAYDSPTGHTDIQSRLSKLRANPEFSAQTFAFALPKGARSRQAGMPDKPAPTNSDSSSPGLLAVGSQAPEFDLPTLNGTKISLRAALKGNKALLICFWNYTFVPCREELPDLNKMLLEFRDRGLDIVTMNSGDSLAVVKKFWQEAGLGLRAAMRADSAVDKYRVSAMPTNYLIGANGKIVARFEGFDETAIRAALPKAGVK